MTGMTHGDTSAPDRTILAAEVGSRAHGLATAASERDYIAIEPMQVRRVEGDPRGSSNIEPQVDDLWSPDDKLSWLLGVACADTGVRFQAMACGSGAGRVYSVQCGSTSFSAVPYHDAWQLVSNLAAGIKIGMGENDRLRDEVDDMQLRLNAADWRETVRAARGEQ